VSRGGPPAGRPGARPGGLGAQRTPNTDDSANGTQRRKLRPSHGARTLIQGRAPLFPEEIPPTRLPRVGGISFRPANPSTRYFQAISGVRLYMALPT
jgi:hypothetical protein